MIKFTDEQLRSQIEGSDLIFISRTTIPTKQDKTIHGGLYHRKSCGHDVLLRFDEARTGEYHCPSCWESEFEKAAAEQNWKYNGKAVNTADNVYRSYTCLDCNHTVDMRYTSMRKHRQICEVCQEARISEKCKQYGFEYIGLPVQKHHKDYEYRNFRRIKCGCIKDLRVSRLKEYVSTCFACKTATVTDLMKGRYERAGIILLEQRKKGSTYKKFLKIDCQHEIYLINQQIKDNDFHCPTCLEVDTQKACEKQNIKILGPCTDLNLSQPASWRWIKCLTCGFEKNANTFRIRQETIGCQGCQLEKHKREASAVGAELIDTIPADDKYRKTYKLPCGHLSKKTPHDITTGNIFCKECNRGCWQRNENTLYILKISVEGFSWLKFGFSKNVERRLQGYGLPETATADLVFSSIVATGEEAIITEKAIHKKYKNTKYPSCLMENYHTRNGFTECYPLDMLETLIYETNQVVNQKTF